ncbi:uncharacterized protein LOC144179529 isoform X2 [Haemaphysalis longicornis]
MSGVRCSVDFCPSHTGSGASMHRFPLGDGPRRQKWIEFVRGAAGRTEWTPRKSSRICSLHFEPACYKQDLPNVLLPRPRCCLEPDAVPSIYNFVGPDSEHSSLSQRPRLEVRIAYVLLACVWCHKYVMTPNIVQALADMHPEDAASPTIWAGPSADCEVNEVEKAAGQVKVDAESQCIVQVSSKATQVVLKAHTKAAKVQTTRTVKEMACQTDLELPDILLMEEMQQRCSTPLRSEPSFTHIDDPLDKTYEPTLNTTCAKFIVYEECLLKVFQMCQTCGLPAECSLQVKGSLATITTTCQENHVITWHSQPKKGKRALGDITLAAAVLFTGGSTKQSLRFLNNAGIACFSERSYHRLQKKLLLPTVYKVWEDEKGELLRSLVANGGTARVAGDSRADSPGYSAKYGVYTLLETSINRIINIQLVQSNEVASSSHMELEGLKRALTALEESGVRVTEAVTDRHPQVRKYFKTEKPEVDHRFDAWHVCKGLNKKLLQAAKSTSCTAISPWSRSLVNHLYFSVKRGDGNGDLAVAVWLSMMNHIQDKHDGHSLQYERCQHGDLEPRKWIFPGTQAFDKLTVIVTSKRLLDDIRQMSPRFQTFSVESFHSIINRFAPKAYAFSFHGMFARTALAALHYNENADNGQAVTRSGEPRFRVKNPKARKGEATASSIKEPPTYDYVARLFSLLEEYVSGGTPNALPVKPPHLTTALVSIDKAALVKSHLSRFGKK